MVAAATSNNNANSVCTLHAVSGFVCVCVMYELQNGINGCNRIRQPKNVEQQHTSAAGAASVLPAAHVE